MFLYDKKLQYPVKIDKPNPKLASIIITQYGGPDGELGASLRYLSQRYSMPFDEPKGTAKENPHEITDFVGVLSEIQYFCGVNSCTDDSLVLRILRENHLEIRSGQRFAGMSADSLHQ